MAAATGRFGRRECQELLQGGRLGATQPLLQKLRADRVQKCPAPLLGGAGSPPEYSSRLSLGEDSSGLRGRRGRAGFRAGGPRIWGTLAQRRRVVHILAPSRSADHILNPAARALLDGRLIYDGGAGRQAELFD